MQDGPQPIGPDIEAALEEVVFADPDPRIQRLKGLWEDAKREAAALFARADGTNYVERLDYHLACGASDAEQLATAETSALRQLLIEERDERLGIIWSDILMRVTQVLEDKEAEAQDA